MTTSGQPLNGGEDEPLTLFAADSLASPSPVRGSGRRRRIAGGSGQRSRGSFAIYDRLTSLWRTFQDSLIPSESKMVTAGSSVIPLHPSKKSLVTWPRSGMTRNGTAYLRSSSVPPIYAAESSSWPIPSANLFECAPEVWQARRERERAKHRNGNGFGLTLSMAVQVWPTPKGSAANYGRPRENDRGDLQAAVMNWPTPTARLGHRRGPQAKRYFDPARSNDLDDAVAAMGTPGQLNPAWVEWLMGYPAGWTDSEDSATPSSPKSPSTSDD